MAPQSKHEMDCNDCRFTGSRTVYGDPQENVMWWVCPGCDEQKIMEVAPRNPPN